MENYSWTCPICNRPVTITASDVRSRSIELDTIDVPCKDGDRIVEALFIVCPNPECKKFTLIVNLHDTLRISGVLRAANVLNTWQLVPPSQAKQFPDYIPKVILDDYNEACLVKDLSPKASAALARRCLQGMVRDFWKVKPGRLGDEINEIKEKVEPLTWKAIDAVRSVGNIGAHMEKDVNLIIDIEPSEAERLITLIETLLKDWYIAHHEREASLIALVELGKDKEGKRKERAGKAEPASRDD